MDLSDIRSEFSIIIVDSDKSRSLKLFESLRGVGYVPMMSHSKESFESSARENPPHVVLYAYENEFIEESYIQKIMQLYPETHFIFVGTDLTLLSAVEFLDKGAYDCIEYPLMGNSIVTHAVDRAIERDFFYYQNEQIKEKVRAGLLFQEDTLVSGKGTKLKELDIAWIQKIQNKSSLNEIIIEYQQYVSKQNFDTEVLFFKYVEPFKTLICVSSIYEDLKNREPLSVDLTDYMRDHSYDEIAGAHSLQEAINESFSVKNYNSLNIKYQGKLFGVLIIFSDQPERRLSLLDELKHQLVCQQCWTHTVMLSMQKLILKDEMTGFYKLDHFIKMLDAEVSRSRRLKLPVSIIIVKVDKVDELVKEYGQERVILFLRKFTNVLSKSTRVNDILGAISETEYAIICAHTPISGAITKAKRIPELLQTESVFAEFPFSSKIGLGRSVAEYPSHCHSATELIDRARLLAQSSTKELSYKVVIPENNSEFKTDF